MELPPTDGVDPATGMRLRITRDRVVHGVIVALALACDAPAAPASPVAPASPAPPVSTPLDLPMTAARPPAAPPALAQVPALREVWSAPEVQYGITMLPGDVGVLGRHRGPPVTFVRLDPRTGAERWRVPTPGDTEWVSATPGAKLVALDGQSPISHNMSFGAADIETGRLLWRRPRAAQTSLVVGRDGTGLALASDCRLDLIDPADGHGFHTIDGQRAGLGHAGPDGTSTVDRICTRPPVLLGQADACALALVPQGVADTRLLAHAPGRPCWFAQLGRTDATPSFAPGVDMLWWPARSGAATSLNVLAFHRDGRVRRQSITENDCWPRASMLDFTDPPVLLVHRCDSVNALTREKIAWSRFIDADALAVIGEHDVVTPRLPAAPEARHLHLLHEDGRTGAAVPVPAHVSAYITNVGVVLVGADAFALVGLDGVERWRLGLAVSRWTNFERWLFLAAGITTLVVDAATGAIVGKDPYGGEAIAVLPAEGAAPALAIVRAGYLRALALP